VGPIQVRESDTEMLWGKVLCNTGAVRRWWEDCINTDRKGVSVGSLNYLEPDKDRLERLVILLAISESPRILTEIVMDNI
jgi:hypothetical protein